MGIDPAKVTERLVARFRANCLAQDETYISGNTRKYNKLFFANVDIVKELASRPGDDRRALLPLLKDENPHVRLQAAKFAYPVSPVECRACPRSHPGGEAAGSIARRRHVPLASEPRPALS